MKVALIATDFVDLKASVKEDVLESDYQKALMDMYYSIPNRKKQDVVDEGAINEETIEQWGAEHMRTTYNYAANRS